MAADFLRNPQIAANLVPTNDDIFIAYDDDVGTDTDVNARVINQTGALGAEFGAAQNSPDFDRLGDVAVLSNGNFVTVYEEGDPAGVVSIEATIRTPAGGVVAPATIFVAAEGGAPAVASLANGGFVITYTLNSNIVVRIFNATGSQLFGAVNVTAGPNVQNEPDVVGLPDGDFVVVWDDDTAGVLRARRYNPDGTPDGDAFTVEDVPTTDPKVGVTADGRILFTWRNQASGEVFASIWDPRGPIIDPDDYGVTRANFLRTDVITTNVTGSEVLAGAKGDTVLGAQGDDTIRSSGDGVFRGGGGDDLIVASPFTVGSDFELLDGGSGNDTLDASSFNGDYTINLITGQTDYSGNPVGGNESFIAFENLFTGNGDDSIVGTGVANFIRTANGADTVVAGSGADTVWGEGDDDSLVGGSGFDLLKGGGGADSLLGGADGDTLLGEAGNDTLRGETGADSLLGGADQDLLVGGSENDTLDGGDGFDTLNGGAGDDVLIGGANFDTASYFATPGALRINLSIVGAQNTLGAGIDSLSGIETVLGGDGDDTLIGDGLANRLDGTLGDDSILGGDSGDTILGGAGDDTLFGEDGDDLLVALEDNDVLTGAEGDDTLNGGEGDDTLNGGLGDDSLLGGPGNDTATYVGAAGALEINLLLTTAQNTISGGVDTLIAIRNLITGDGNDTLRGDGLGNVIDAGNGADSVSGGGGVDTLIGGAGADTLRGEGDADSLIGGANDDLLDGGVNNDTLEGGDGADRLIGRDGQDTLNGGGAADVFEWNAVAESAFAAPDVIVGGFLNPGAGAGDLIDLIDVDANSVAGGVQDFVFGTLTGIGRLWAIDDPGSTDTFILGNVDGVGTPDLAIRIQDGAGVFASAYTAADFLV